MLELTPHLSYLGIMAVLILSGTGFPIPEEVPVVLAGYASSVGQLHPWLAFAACLFGALVGDSIMYSIGYHFGHAALREHRFFARFIKPEREKRIERMIEQHGLKAFFAARFLVGLRSPMFLAAGILRVPLRRFLLADLFCATMVISVFFGLSYYFAAQLEASWKWIRGAEMGLSAGVVAAVAIVIIWYVHRRRLRWQRVLLRRRRRQEQQQQPADRRPSEKVAETETIV